MNVKNLHIHLHFLWEVCGNINILTCLWCFEILDFFFNISTLSTIVDKKTLWNILLLWRVSFKGRLISENYFCNRISNILKTEISISIFRFFGIYTFSVLDFAIYLSYLPCFYIILVNVSSNLPRTDTL